MNNTVTEAPVISSDEPPIPSTEDPLSRGPELPIVHQCAGPCHSCAVQKELSSGPFPVTNHAAQQRQRLFNANAKGFRTPADKYTLRLDQKEAALNRLKQNVAGCTKLVNGTRVRIESMLYHAVCSHEQEVAAERALYVRDESREVPVPRSNEEIHALLYDKPMTPEESVGLVERIRSLLGGSERI